MSDRMPIARGSNPMFKPITRLQLVKLATIIVTITASAWLNELWPKYGWSIGFISAALWFGMIERALDTVWPPGPDPVVLVRLPQEMFNQIDAEASENGASMSDALRQLIELGLKAKGGKR